MFKKLILMLFLAVSACGLESYQISGETFYVAKNVRLSDIEEDSDFYNINVSYDDSIYNDLPDISNYIKTGKISVKKTVHDVSELISLHNLTFACSPPDKTLTLLSICFVVSPHLANADLTSY